MPENDTSKNEMNKAVILTKANSKRKTKENENTRLSSTAKDQKISEKTIEEDVRVMWDVSWMSHFEDLMYEAWSRHQYTYKGVLYILISLALIKTILDDRILTSYASTWDFSWSLNVTIYKLVTFVGSDSLLTKEWIGMENWDITAINSPPKNKDATRNIIYATKPEDLTGNMSDNSTNNVIMSFRFSILVALRTFPFPFDTVLPADFFRLPLEILM